MQPHFVVPLTCPFIYCKWYVSELVSTGLMWTSSQCPLASHTNQCNISMQQLVSMSSSSLDTNVCFFPVCTDYYSALKLLDFTEKHLGENFSGCSISMLYQPALTFVWSHAVPNCALSSFTIFVTVSILLRGTSKMSGAKYSFHYLCFADHARRLRHRYRNAAYLED